MASLCRTCELQFDHGLRLPKVLPCGHMACLACLEECARAGGGRMCPICRKVFKSKIAELVTVKTPNSNTMWCRDCEAEAKAACFEQHVLCGLGRMQRETAVELEAAWDDRAALLNTLAEDVRVEKQQLKKMRDGHAPERLGLGALRGALAAAKQHPLRGLPGLETLPAGRHPQGRLLHRALGALRLEEDLRAREAAVQEKETTLAERQTAVQTAETVVARARAAVKKREASLAKREAALDKKAPVEAIGSKRAGVGLTVRTRGGPRIGIRGGARGGLASSKWKELMSAKAAPASSSDDSDSDDSAAPGRQHEQPPVRPALPSAPRGRTVTTTSDSSSSEEQQPPPKRNKLGGSPPQKAPANLSLVGNVSMMPMTSSSDSDTSSEEGGQPIRPAPPKAAAAAPAPRHAAPPAKASSSEWDDSSSEEPSHAGCTDGKPNAVATKKQVSVSEKASPASSARQAVPPAGKKPSVPYNTSTSDDSSSSESAEKAVAVRGWVVSNGTASWPKPPPPSSSDSDDTSTADERSVKPIATATDSAPTEPGMASLPEELLQRILALVPLYNNLTRRRRAGGVPDLLQLRLVCRRWARSVLSPAVWRHRELDYNNDSGPMAAVAPGLLRHVPEVGRLICNVSSKSAEEMEALGNSSIRVRSLKLCVEVSHPACLLTKRLLRKKPVEELHLTLRVSHVKSTTAPLLQHVDSLRGLKALTLEYWPTKTATFMQGPLKHLFRQLTGLTKLSLGMELHPDTVRSMLEASKLTLRELDCGDYDVAHLVASTASRLRCIRVTGKGVSANLVHLRQLKHLDVLKTTVEYFHYPDTPNQPNSRERSKIVRQFLNSSPLVPREVHLTLNGFQALHHWNTVLGMRRVSNLTVICGARSLASVWEIDYQCLTSPLCLPDVEKLFTYISLSMDPWWKWWGNAWTDSTAPKLRELCVGGRSCRGPVSDEECCVSFTEWLNQVMVKRPHVKIYYIYD